MEVFHHLKGNTVPRKQSISIAQPLATSNLSLWICLLQTFHMNGILLSAGPLWPASFTEQDVLKVHRIVASVSHLFLFVAEYYSEVRIDHTLLIHPLDDGIWVVFTFLAITNNAATFTYKHWSECLYSVRGVYHWTWNCWAIRSR